MNVVVRAGSAVLLGFFCASFSVLAQTPVVIQTNTTVRIMAANLTSGSAQSYETAGIHILQGLKPDIIAIQEFRYNGSTSDAQLRQLVNTAFGTNFFYYREPGNYNIPNGIVSRWPFISTGTWEDVDAGVNDRGFAWARIDLPGTNELYVVSIHLKASSGSDNAARRYAEATNLVNLIKASFPSDAWIIVGGDCNIFAPSELAYQHLANTFSDNPIPTDAETGGDADTNAARTERYDYVYVSKSLTNQLVPTVFPSHIFPKGLVFDSQYYSPLSDVSPVLAGDSHVTAMQHMGVVRDFTIAYSVTNYLSDPPSITLQPPNLTAVQSSNVTFTIAASGSTPLFYQWRFNSTDIAGATTNSYTRFNVQPAHAGTYSVLVTNSAGSIISSNAILTLFVPQPVLTTLSSGLLQWQGLSNLAYTVQAKTNLIEANWISIGSASSPTATISFTNQSGSTQRFYRVVYP